MIDDVDLAAVHGYLCSDGYVIKNQGAGHKYYYVGFRNTNETLLKDFQERFTRAFGIEPIITKNRDRCKIQNKELVLRLLRRFGSFHSGDWKMPDMSSDVIGYWLRAYFDSDSWVSVVERKDRKIGLDSINGRGLSTIRDVLLEIFDIDSSVRPRRKRNTSTLAICGRDDLKRFQEEIGFLHPDKFRKLDEALDSYVDYEWDVPGIGDGFIEFLMEKGRVSEKRGQVRFNSIKKSNLEALRRTLIKMGVEPRLNGPWTNPQGSEWYCLTIKMTEFKKLTEEVTNKWDSTETSSDLS